MSETRRFYVSGLVQGVYYRASTVQHAIALGLTGWARNLPDGRVEVLARGETAALADLEEWLWQGPDEARVDAVTTDIVDASQAEGCTDFQVR